MLIPVTILLAVAVVKKYFYRYNLGYCIRHNNWISIRIIDVSDIMSVQDGTLSGFTIDGIKGML